MKKEPPIFKSLTVGAPHACRILDVSLSFFYENISTGRIPKPIKIGKKSLWSVKVLEAWVAGGCLPVDQGGGSR